MITLLAGENSFEIARTLQKLVVAFDGQAEKIEGSDLELKQLPDLLMGATLFAEKRLIIIKELSENKSIWNDFNAWALRVNDDVHLVLVESKPDKRTKTYKTLQKTADVYEFMPWSERDTVKAEKWAVDEAGRLGLSLDAKSAHVLVARIGADQWLLFQALQKLVVIGEVTPAIIEDFVEANPAENVFNLFDAALRGDATRVKRMLEILELSEDSFRLFGLLAGQAFQLAALAVSEKSDAEVAKDFGAHPFALSKLVSHAKKLGQPGARWVITAFAEADEGMKTGGEPWLLIERALIKVANLR